MTEHRRFTVAETNYLRNLDHEDLNARCVAVLHQAPPEETERGRGWGLRIPVLIVTQYLDNQDDVAQRVADILEQHWDDEPAAPAGHPEPPLPDQQLENGGACS